MLVSMMILAALIMAFAPQTPVARWLHRTLVEAPARLLARVERKHLFFAAIMLVLALNITAIGPLDMMMAGMWDAAVFLDIVTAAFAVTTIARSRSAWMVIRNRMAGPIARIAARRPRSRAVRRRTRRDADDDAGGRRAPLPVLLRRPATRRPKVAANVLAMAA